MSDHEGLREFLAGQSPAWLADRLVRAAGRDRVLLAELQSAGPVTVSPWNPPPRRMTAPVRSPDYLKLVPARSSRYA